MSSPYSHEGTSFCVSDTGNTLALCMCLSSVLNAKIVPHRIQILMQGKYPSFANFYLEQLADMARLSGVEFAVYSVKPLGVRGARDWHLDNCPTQYLWMGDNDVLYSPECLEILFKGWEGELRDKQAYVQGVKSDINNRRGYRDFFDGVHPLDDLKDFSSPNHRYQQLSIGMLRREHLPTYDVATIDTGNVLFNMKLIKDRFRFSVFDDSLNCGGEDTLMALLLRKNGLIGRFMPWAVSFHLEKPNPVFEELTTRGEMLLRACDQLGLDKDLLRKGFAPWVWNEIEKTNEKENQKNSQENPQREVTKNAEKIYPKGSRED